MTDSWVNCSCGGRHWGAYGAAGLLLLDDDGRVLLQKRAGASQHGGTWGIPGGAKATGETDSGGGRERRAGGTGCRDARRARPTIVLLCR